MRIQGQKGFNVEIFICIEKALQSLGESVGLSFFYQIEKKFHFPREEFASKPIEFMKCLEELLGTSGSVIVERLIVREIRSAFNLRASPSNSTMEGAIAEAKKNFLTG
ncbi:MAG TPA: hypothetical protein VNE86_00395 [Nitrososphaerales archaeon]|nr:hypothetical protein [Nitrososphaerales archaeon]